MPRPPAAPPDAHLLLEVLQDASEPTGADVEVEPLPGGASRDSWLVTVGERRYVLKRDPLHEREPRTSRLREYQAAHAARDAGVPVARPVWFESAGGRFGSAGLLSDFVAGTSSPREILKMDVAGLAGDVGRAAGRLAKAAILASWDPPADPLDAVLEEIRGGLRFLAPNRPVLALGLRWAELNRPAAVQPVLVHGDFRIGNFMVDPDGLTAVIDWEFTSVGCPGQDLGFFCLRPWRFGADGARAGGVGSLDELLEGYAETAPVPLDAAAVRYWEVIGQLRWGLYCLLQELTYRQGGHASLERLVIGRRLPEIEWDLLDLMEEDV